MLAYLFFIFICLFQHSNANNLTEYNSSKVLDDLQNDLRALGSELNIYTLTTKDGYILKLFRIRKSDAEKGIPIVFLHGLFGCGDAWFMQGNKSLPILLSRRGYDIWVINSRGTQYSLNHLWLDNKEKEYWRYSFQEVADYDFPVIFDFILANNAHTKIIPIAHSSGTTQLLAFLATQTKYNENIIVNIHFAPTASYKNFNLEWHRSMSSAVDFWMKFSESIKWYSIWPWGYPNARNMLIEVCTLPLFHKFCGQGFISISEDEEQIKHWDVLDVFKRVPCGGSLWELFHYMQSVNKGHLHHFDYGPKENLRRYNTTIAPIYDFSKITSPTALFYGVHDDYVPPKDVEDLASMMPNVVYMKQIYCDEWAHLDFIMGKDVYREVYIDVLKLIKRLTRKLN